MSFSFSQAFQSKVAEVDAAKSRLNTFIQRLTFAKRRVETIQGKKKNKQQVYMFIAVPQFDVCLRMLRYLFSGLVMRKVALQKVEQACKQSEKAADRYG